MNLINSTNFAAGFSPGRLKDGSMCLVVVAKATYSFPEKVGGQLKLSSDQVDMLDHDIPWGDPETTPSKFENDFSPIKPCCDILIHGCAHSPNGDPVERVRVGASVGHWSKQFDVVGDRYWCKGMTGWIPSKPECFIKKELSWMVAYGGVDQYKENRSESCLVNPSGVGFWHKLDHRLEGTSVPNTEEVGRPVKSPGANYIPQGFGPIGRHWIPRRNFAGTYDEKWERDRAPFLPVDFDERYFQCAAPDQQVPYLKGDEMINLFNLTEHGSEQFQLRDTGQILMTVVNTGGKRVSLKPVIDTLIIDCENRTVSVVWRAHSKLKYGAKEVASLLVGRPTRGWERARLMGKAYVPMGRLSEHRAELNDEIEA